jgi:CrcB protein
MNTLLQLAGIGFAGALGTLARYGVNIGAAVIFGTSYPFGTYFVNILGSFLFGIGTGLFSYNYLSPTWKIIFLTGFLGGFTTFSAFAFENQQFLTDRRWGALALHLIGQNILGIAAVLFGLIFASWIVKP